MSHFDQKKASINLSFAADCNLHYHKKPKPDFSRENFEEVTYAGYVKRSQNDDVFQETDRSKEQYCRRKPGSRSNGYVDIALQLRWEGWCQARAQHFMHHPIPVEATPALQECSVCGAAEIEMEQFSCEEFRLGKELKLAKSQLVSRFDGDEVPLFTQGEATHELQTLVTAEECNRALANYKTRGDELKSLQKRFTRILAEVESVLLGRD